MKDKKDKLNTGFVCNCGEEHFFPLYVYAHWTEDMAFTCPTCNKVWNVCYGIARYRGKQAKEIKG